MWCSGILPLKSGASVQELKLHYYSLGKPRHNDQGIVRNAVLVLHGTTGSGASLQRNEFIKELFGADQPLDASRYFITFLTPSVTANQANRAMDSTPDFPTMATGTWSWHNIDCSPKG